MPGSPNTLVICEVILVLSVVLKPITGNLMPLGPDDNAAIADCRSAAAPTDSPEDAKLVKLFRLLGKLIGERFNPPITLAVAALIAPVNCPTPGIAFTAFLALLNTDDTALIPPGKLLNPLAIVDEVDAAEPC
jgi:hypothetical protein